jgi:hypothetical protein
MGWKQVMDIIQRIRPERGLDGLTLLAHVRSCRERISFEEPRKPSLFSPSRPLVAICTILLQKLRYDVRGHKYESQRATIFHDSAR